MIPARFESRNRKKDNITIPLSGQQLKCLATLSCCPFVKRVAEAIGALRAPVGEGWWSYKNSWPDLEMYAEDGAHASEAGSDFAAKLIWAAIRRDLSQKETYEKL